MRQLRRAGHRCFVDHAGQKPHLVTATGATTEVELFVAVRRLPARLGSTLDVIVLSLYERMGRIPGRSANGSLRRSPGRGRRKPETAWDEYGVRDRGARCAIESSERREMSDTVDRWSAILNRPLSRRDLLKAGASSALLATLAGSPRSALGGSSKPPKPRRIVRAAIHPAIGIARVGNSQKQYYFGPEIPGGLPIAPDGYKDGRGAMKRQAARFRIFGLDAEGQVVRELVEKEATIEWTVHLANMKASWYDFETALDIPEAEPTTRRNPAYRRIQRDALMIDPGPRQVAGRNDSAVFDTGKFLGNRVYLGEIRTDKAGHLL